MENHKGNQKKTNLNIDLNTQFQCINYVRKLQTSIWLCKMIMQYLL